MTIAVDFDGVIHAYSKGWADGTIYDPPLPGALDGIRALMERDAVFIFTSRNTEQVANWLFEHGEFNITWEPPGETTCEFWNDRDRVLITNRKLPAVAYLDDRAVRFVDWDQALSALGTTDPPLSPYYSHEACGFHWHGRDGLDIPMRDGQPVCPRCELTAATTNVVVARLTALCERWVKAGPPLGVSISRWWDARLIELRDAITPPQERGPRG